MVPTFTKNTHEMHGNKCKIDSKSNKLVTQNREKVTDYFLNGIFANFDRN